MGRKGPFWCSVRLHCRLLRPFSDSFMALDFSHLSQTGWVAHRPSAQRKAISSRLNTPLSDIGDEARSAALRKGLLREFWPDLPGRLAVSFCHCVPFCYSCA